MPYAGEDRRLPRASKEPWEIEYMKQAQAITDRTFTELLNVIHAGMTEKELCAELIYRLYKFGAEGPSFDPIVVSGPNTSLPHGVPSERKLAVRRFRDDGLRLPVPRLLLRHDADRRAGLCLREDG